MKLTVLHIDDDPDVRLLVRELARPAPQIQVLDAPGVEEAIARYSGLEPDTILLDNRLGASSGLELLPRIRQIWSCPVWILSGFSRDLLHERAAQCGAAGVISKDELLEDAAHFQVILHRAATVRERTQVSS